jgi:hypothetical protein
MLEPDLESDEVRPWELPGAVRRDCEPHRAKVLARLSLAGATCSLFALFLWVPGLLGVTMGLAVWVMAAGNLNKMRAGVMDREGEAQTKEALVMARLAVLLGIAFLLLIGCAFWRWLLTMRI